MLDPAFVRDNIDVVRRRMACARRRFDKDLEQLATLESQRRRLIPQFGGTQTRTEHGE